VQVLTPTAVRSEGMVVTSFNVFLSGLMASRADCPWQVDTRGL
jgi:hypothetical protein